MQKDHQKALALQQEQFSDEISKQVCRLGEEYDAKMLAASQEMKEKLAAAVLKKEELETHIRTVEEQFNLTKEQHQQTLANLESQHNEQLTTLKKHYEEQVADLEVQHEHRVTEMETRHEVEIAELKALNDQLTMNAGKLQQEMTTQMDQLNAKNAALELELNTCRKHPVTLVSDTEKEYKSTITRLKGEKSHIEQRLKAAEDQLQKMQTEKCTLTKTHEELRESLERKVAGLQTKLEEADQKCEELIAREHDSMQREHELVVAALQEKLTEKNGKDRAAAAAGSQVCYCPLS